MSAHTSGWAVVEGKYPRPVGTASGRVDKDGVEMCARSDAPVYEVGAVALDN